MAMRPRRPNDPEAGSPPPVSVDRWLQIVSILMSVAALLFVGGIGYQVASGWEMKSELEAARKLSRDIEELRRDAVEHTQTIKELAEGVAIGKVPDDSVRSDGREDAFTDHHVEILELMLAARGLRRVGGGQSSGRLASSGEEEIRFRLEEGNAMAVTARCGGDCDLTLFGPDGSEKASDWLPDRYPVLDYTPEQSGEFSIRVTMFDCPDSSGEGECEWELTRWGGAHE